MRLAAIVVAVVVGTGAVAVVAAFPGPTVAYLTHWKGSPNRTTAYEPPSPADPPVLRLAVAGDIGDSGGRLDRTAAAVTALAGDRGYDVLLLLGDNVYPEGDPARLGETVFGPFGTLLAGGTELLAILGNHDVKDGHGSPQMAALGMPGRWWARSLGDVLLVGLDSNDPDDPEQLAFLEQALSGSEARWKIVALHHSPYSAGYQGSSEDSRRVFSPLFERFGVQLVLSGHDHDYQRSKVIRGVTYVVTGAGAGSRRTGEHWFTAESFSWHHFVELDVWPDRLVGQAVNQKERVADRWVLR